MFSSFLIAAIAARDRQFVHLLLPANKLSAITKVGSLVYRVSYDKKD